MAVPIITAFREQNEDCRQMLEEYLNRIAQEDSTWVGRAVLELLPSNDDGEARRHPLLRSLCSISEREVLGNEPIICEDVEGGMWEQPPGEVVSGFYGERHRWQPMEGHFMGEPQDTPPEPEDAVSPMITISQEAMDAIAQSHDDEGAEAEEEAPAATEISQEQWEAIVPLLEANRLDSDNVVVVSPDMVAYVQEGDAIRAVQLTDINPDAVPDEQPEDVEPTGKQVSPDDLDDLFSEIDGLVQEGEGLDGD